MLIYNEKLFYEKIKKYQGMTGFCELNLNISNLTPKLIDQLVKYATKCKININIISQSFLIII